MGNHKNHGNKLLPHVPGFRPGRAPAIINQDKPITTKMGINADKGIVIVEYDRAVNNLHMTIEQVDVYIEHLNQCRKALLDAGSKAAAEALAQGRTG